MDRVARAGTMAGVLLWAALVAVVPPAGDAAEAVRDTGRVAGADRLGTAVQISRRAFPDGAEVTYLARSDVFADALAAGTLTDGPVLLVPSCGELPSVVRDEIVRLDPGQVLALGGPSAVCDALLGAASAGRGGGRVAGADRYETAVQIARRAFPDGAPEVYLASAADSPDAVAGGSLTGGPILLVPKEGAPPPVVEDEIARLEAQRVVALGGPVAISDATVLAAASGRTTLRLAGRDRYETAARIAEYQFGPASPTATTATVAYIARGDLFADAVAAGSLADGPVLLVPSCDGLPEAAGAQIGRIMATAVLALGGPLAVCDATLEAAGAVTSDVVIPDTTVVLDGAARGALRADEDGVLVFDAAGAPTVQVDDVLVSYEVPGVAPQGLLRRVVAVSVEGDVVRVTTEPASLTDAIHDGDFQLDVPLTRVDLVGAGGRAATRQTQATAHLIDLDHLATVPIAPGVTLTGVLTYDASFQVDVDVDLLPSPHVDTFVAALDFDESVDLTLTAEGAATWAPSPVTLWEGEFRCFWTAVGPVPVSLCPTVSVELNASGEVEGSITMGAGQQASARFGAAYEDGDWSRIKEHTNEHNLRPPSLRVDAQAAGGVRAQLGLEVYDLAGPFVYGVLYVRGEGAVADDMVCWGVYAGLSGGFGVAVDSDILGDVEIPDLQLLALEVLLAEDPVPHDVCSKVARKGPSWYGTVSVAYDIHATASNPSSEFTNHAEAVFQLTGAVTTFEYAGSAYDVVDAVVLSASETMSSNDEYYQDGGSCWKTNTYTSGELGPNEGVGYSVRPSASSAAPVFTYIGAEYEVSGRDTSTCDPPYDDTYSYLGSAGFHTDFEAPTVEAVPGGRRICDTITFVKDESGPGWIDQYTVTATFAIADGTASPTCPGS